ncbi:unnamed protein product [Allacma fusca]|uniref:limulus clotting factor C n=1 Tax=Allacma fusca TaxID=39272 RepID=A0A8J2LIR9_9HEXA|nr:unnamed protein product [Allacma fusca]
MHKLKYWHRLLSITVGFFHAGQSLDPPSKLGQPIGLTFTLSDAICSQFSAYQDAQMIPPPVKEKPLEIKKCAYFDEKCDGESCRFQFSSCDGNGSGSETSGTGSSDSQPGGGNDDLVEDDGLPPVPVSKKRKLGTRIVGGARSKKYKYPSIVLLRSKGQHICSGTILNEEFVLTAAHCFQTFQASDYEMVAAEHNKDRNDGHEQTVQAIKLFIHADYDDETQVNDITLLKVSPKFKFNDKVQAVVLPAKTYDPKPNINMWFAGWGRLVEDGETPDILHEVTLPIIQRARCKAVLADYTITDNHLCAGGRGGKDTCEGDSGGPMYLIEGEKQTQVGIVSWGLGCAEVGLPGVYTRVSSYLDWISEKMVQGKAIKGIRTNYSRGRGGAKAAPQSVKASPYEFPSIVLIKMNDKHVCSGTIVDKEWVLSAAQCFQSKNPSDYTVIAADFNKDQGEGSERALGVQTIQFHSGYNNETMENDIALLKLSTALHFGSRKIQPAVIPDGDYKPSGKVTSVGWGKISETNGISPVLQKVYVDVVSSFQCIDWLETPALYTEKVICTGFSNETRDICLGESGSPLYTTRGGNHYLLGISSWGETCAKRNSPRVYTKVPKYLDWINQVVTAPDRGRAATSIRAGKAILASEPHKFSSVAILKLNGVHICSATIININWVLTAAHCITSIRDSDYAIVAGVHDKEKSESSRQTVMATHAVVHENYTNGHDNDIALLRVNPSFKITKFVKAVSMPNRVYRVKPQVTVVGWGVNDNISDSENILQRVDLTITNLSECQGGLNPLKFICINSVNKTVNPCVGDFGGPVLNMKGDIHKLIGIAGRRKCQQKNQPQFYTNAVKYIPWIVRTMQIYSGPRSNDRFQGIEALRGEFKSVVIVKAHRKPRCVGTLLNKQWVLTSSSCVSGYPMSSILVQAGVYDSRDGDDGEQISDVEAIYNFPLSTKAIDLNNIALIKLNFPLELGEFVKRASMSQDRFTADSLTAVGWGIDEDGVQTSSRMLKADLNISDVCIEASSKFLCLKNPVGGLDSCVGDRGSPVFTSDGHLFGVVSAENPCGDRGNPSEVAVVATFSSWMKSTMEENRQGSSDTTIQAAPGNL